MKQREISAWRYAGLTHEEFHEILGDFLKPNLKILQSVSCFVTIASFVFGLKYVGDPECWAIAAGYFVLSVVNMLIFALAMWTAPKNRELEYFLIFIHILSIYANGIYDAVITPEHYSVTFMVAIIVIPQVYNACLLYSVLTTVFAAINFIVWSIAFANESLVPVYVADAILFGVLSIILDQHVTDVKLRRCLSEKRALDSNR
ncbi:MAG: hypothetical protein Q4B58_03965 [Bacteroidales bacterium]|nr:hypothetical protein [Bacteroidales bacterium]